MITTSPASISRRWSAAMTCSSWSKTFTGPEKRAPNWCPATLRTQPSGAKLPCRMTNPPFSDSGSSTRRTTSFSSGLVSTSARFSAMVWPVTVMQSPWIRPASRSRLVTRGTPPTRSRSNMTYFPPGFMSAMRGVRIEIAWMSSRVSSMPASCAMAGK